MADASADRSVSRPDSLIATYLTDPNTDAREFAMRRLVEDHHERLVDYFYIHCRDVDDAKDLAQQTWLQVLPRLAALREPRSFEAYLNRARTNVLRDFWRSRRSFQEVALNEDDKLVEQTDMTQKQEIGGLVAVVINSLSQRDRSVYLLREYSHATYEQISAELQISAGAARMIVSRTRGKLAQLYREWSASASTRS